MNRLFRNSLARWLTGTVVLMIGLLVGWMLYQPRQPFVFNGGERQQLQTVEITNENDAKIVAFCGGCHDMPKPTSFPKASWHDEVKRGFEFYYQSNRPDLIPPPVLAVEEYFRSRAPDQLMTIPDPPGDEPGRVHFRVQEINLSKSGSDESNPPAISFISHWPVPGSTRQALLVSEMANGGVDLGDPRITPFTTRRLTRLNNPLVATGCDLNGNGLPDLIVADLGSFLPADHALGRVSWLPDVNENQSPRPGLPLAEGLGRVADVQAADFDRDGDADLIVAEFGWHRTGRILLLRNVGDVKTPRFATEVIDSRPGTIHVPIVDLNKDGRPDFVALISQEFEVIEAFLGQGDGTFKKHTVFSAGDPAFGSSGIQLVDLDQDGDQDILYTNGDMFDSFLIKPYYGVQWLENTGSYPFTRHPITKFPGVLRALAGDLDRDGDLDIVAAAFLPARTRESAPGGTLDSLIWLEQKGAGQFVRHTIEKGNCIRAALDLADLDGDGDLDIVTGAFRERDLPGGSAATIWWNEPDAR